MGWLPRLLASRQHASCYDNDLLISILLPARARPFQRQLRMSVLILTPTPSSCHEKVRSECRLDEIRVR